MRIPLRDKIPLGWTVRNLEPGEDWRAHEHGAEDGTTTPQDPGLESKSPMPPSGNLRASLDHWCCAEGIE